MLNNYTLVVFILLLRIQVLYVIIIKVVFSTKVYLKDILLREKSNYTLFNVFNLEVK